MSYNIGVTTKVINTRNRLLKTKTCSCGQAFDRLPVVATHSDDEGFGGYYWNCDCKSTLFIVESLVSTESACECIECQDSDNPCDCDCGECQGCQESRKEQAIIRHQAYVSLGGR